MFGHTLLRHSPSLKNYETKTFSQLAAECILRSCLQNRRPLCCKQERFQLIVEAGIFQLWMGAKMCKARRRLFQSSIAQIASLHVALRIPCSDITPVCGGVCQMCCHVCCIVCNLLCRTTIPKGLGVHYQSPLDTSTTTIPSTNNNNKKTTDQQHGRHKQIYSACTFTSKYIYIYSNMHV